MPKKSVFIFIVLLAALALVVLAFLAFPQRQAPQASAKLTVAATFLPVADIAKHIGGPDVQVVTLLPPGASPHTFQPTPEQIKELQDAKTILAIGHGIDDWARTLADNVPGIRYLVTDRDIKLRQAADGMVDPHYWLDAKNGKIIARNIAFELARLDPPHAADYQLRLDDYQASLDALDQRIRDLFKDKTAKEIVTHHDAWQYFAAAYGLKVAGVLEPVPGRELTPQELAALENTIRQDKIKVVYSEPELSDQLLIPLAKDTGVKIVNLDPEGGSDGIASYQDILLKNAQTLAQNME